mmetsp:Transcript_11782/g.20997  ORF Transcript_11782/g.20997 Transcript_11782/m.20997 type:complete len:111 (-) Transcript_11782:531-863(-)
MFDWAKANKCKTIEDEPIDLPLKDKGNKRQMEKEKDKPRSGTVSADFSKLRYIISSMGLLGQKLEDASSVASNSSVSSLEVQNERTPPNPKRRRVFFADEVVEPLTVIHE